MKKLFVTAAILFSLSAIGQKTNVLTKIDSTPKVDTLIEIRVKPQDFEVFLKWLDNLEVSHQQIKAILALFYNNAKMITVPKR